MHSWYSPQFTNDIPQCTNDVPKALTISSNALNIAPQCIAQPPVDCIHVIQGDSSLSFAQVINKAWQSLFLKGRFLLRFKEVTDAKQYFYELKQCQLRKTDPKIGSCEPAFRSLLQLYHFTLLSNELCTPAILKINAFRWTLSFSADFFKQAKYKQRQ